MPNKLIFYWTVEIARFLFSLNFSNRKDLPSLLGKLRKIVNWTDLKNIS